jgi:hypothetical protein
LTVVAGATNVDAVVTADYTATSATINRSDASDDVTLTYNDGIDVNLSAATSTVTGFTIVGKTGNATGSTISGSDQNDAITGTAAADSIVAGAGNDSITGSLGADTVTTGLGADNFTSVIANATVSGFSLDAGAGVNTLSITDEGATDLVANVTYTGFTTLTLAAASAGKATTLNQRTLVTGAVTVTLTDTIDGDNDTIILHDLTTTWQAAAETNAADVTEAGEYHLEQDVANDGVLTFYNEYTSGVTTMTITGLDLGAVADSAAGSLLTFTG